MKRWEAGERSASKYCKPRVARYDNLDKIMWEWFTRARLGHSEFTASNGWLAR